MLDFLCKESYDLRDFVALITFLRSPDGCPWDQVQTHESIRRNFLEETCEAVEAIDNHDMPALREELGDVLMQVIFHAQMEAEVGGFTMQDVIDGLCRKLVYRHPHVFSDVKVANSDEVLTNWEALKRQEKAQSSLCSRSCPSLSLRRASILAKRSLHAAGVSVHIFASPISVTDTAQPAAGTARGTGTY